MLLLIWYQLKSCTEPQSTRRAPGGAGWDRGPYDAVCHLPKLALVKAGDSHLCGCGRSSELLKEKPSLQPCSQMGHVGSGPYLWSHTGEGWLCQKQVLLSRDSGDTGREVAIAQGFCVQPRVAGPCWVISGVQPMLTPSQDTLPRYPPGAITPRSRLGTLLALQSCSPPSPLCATPHGNSGPQNPWQAINRANCSP